MHRFACVFITAVSILTGCAPAAYIAPTETLNPSNVIHTALSLKGKPYRYGGVTPDGFDCTGFLLHVFSEFGVQFPRTTSRLAHKGKKIAKRNLLPGDIVFFHTIGIFPKPTHAGLYIGEGQFIHAGTSEPSGVRVDSLKHPYYDRRFLFGRRLFK